MDIFLMERLHDFKAYIDKGLHSISIEDEPDQLYSPIEYMLSIGGKRVRPLLCLATYSLFSKNISDSILFPTLSLEIFHAFTLVHDDIMDNADKRRGQLSIHKKWNQNVAILSGDVMSILAYKYLSYADEVVIKRIYSLFTKTAIQVCEGQQFDMDYEKKLFITMQEYQKMIGLKTAALIACSAKMGAILAGQEAETANLLYKYGYELGMAFQITDDYLDVYGDSSTFGKKIGGDIVNNKKSWLLVECARRAEGSNNQRLMDIMNIGEERSEEKIAAMIGLYEELNIKSAAEEEIEKYYNSALDSIKSLGIEKEEISFLRDFASMIVSRRK